jgi:hypothetical protein
MAAVGFGMIPVGHIIVDEFLNRLRRASEFDDPREQPGVALFVTGCFERLLAFILFAICIETGSAVTALGIWVGLKLATNWQILGEHSDDRNVRVGAFTALMAGVLSVGLGAFGGWLFRFGCDFCNNVTPLPPALAL